MTSNLAILLKRIDGRDVDLALEDEHAWLERFLDRWAVAEEEFFQIALEREEKDAFSKAISLHLVGEDEVAPQSIRLRAYKRPSTMRRINEEARAQMASEEQEMEELKRQRKELRNALAKSRKQLRSMNNKLTSLEKRSNEYEGQLLNVLNRCDALLADTTQQTLSYVEAITADFEQLPNYAALLQQIALSLGEKYSLIQNLYKRNSNVDEDEDEESIERESWILSRAYSTLEDRIYERELENILQQLENGASWTEVGGQECSDELMPVGSKVKELIQNAWRRDVSTRLSQNERALEATGKALEANILPPLVLLYMGLTRLRSHIATVHALGDVLLAEISEFAVKLQEIEPELDDDDDLLLRLAEVLALSSGAEDEISEEAVLQKLEELKATQHPDQ